jgi:integrase
VPHYKHPFHLPVTYSEEEISRLENAIDKKSSIGKRDYALILLATRLGMRSGDIVNLTLDKLDFDNNTITFNQEKTGEIQQLPMLTEIRDAITEYVNNVRPPKMQQFCLPSNKCTL